MPGRVHGVGAPALPCVPTGAGMDMTRDKADVPPALSGFESLRLHWTIRARRGERPRGWVAAGSDTSGRVEAGPASLASPPGVSVTSEWREP